MSFRVLFAYVVSRWFLTAEARVRSGFSPREISNQFVKALRYKSEGG